jgi:hypothetical protein
MLADDLKAARALIDTPEKWIQRAGDDGYDTPCCAVVAVNRRNRYGTPENDAMRKALYLQLPAEYRHGGTLYGMDVGAYNDDPRTTHADIMALFDRAIEAASPSHPKEPVL